MQAEFSAGGREEQWGALGRATFDLLVIGAGITGSGIARDAAGRGLNVAVVDAYDVGGGTSSRSSRLVHGGLRYLETFDFDLVFEALRERRRLLELAPHLVHPLAFLFPVYDGDPTSLLKLTAGMWLYETLSLFRSPRRHRIMRRGGLLSEEPLLRSAGLNGGALYYDAQVDDARLTLAVARAAHDSGSTIVTHAGVTELSFPATGPATAVVEDRLEGRKTAVRARVVLNATGPWSDRVRAIADPAATSRLRTTKGVHVIVERDRLANRNAIIFRSPVDGRVMFVLPWGDFTYVGTTDTEFAGDPGDAHADPADVEYLLKSANAIFPTANLEIPDVVATWAGVRPLLAPASAEQLSESATSREHEIWRDQSGLMNIAGGKLTTYRSMAAEAVDRVAEFLRTEYRETTGECFTELLPLPGADDFDEGVLRQRAQRLGLSTASLEHLSGRYGSDTGTVLDLVESDPDLGSVVLAGRPYLRAEVVHAVRHEMALTLEDVLRRRLQLFYEASDGGLAAARQMAELIAGEEGLGWDAAMIDRQVEAYREAVRQTRPERLL
ncbi:MAG: glycerol-3-phosphate dehydrogenase/oxidase [Gemmatimonadota bacterium]